MTVVRFSDELNDQTAFDQKFEKRFWSGQKVFISKQYLDEIWWSRVIDNSASTLRGEKKKKHVALQHDPSTNSSHQTINFSHVTSILDKSWINIENLPALDFMNEIPMINASQDPKGWQGKSFRICPSIMSRRLPDVMGAVDREWIKYEKLSALDVQKQEIWSRSDSERTTRNQKSSFLISHLLPSSELYRAVEASSGKPQKRGHDGEWRWRRIRDYIYQVRDFLLLPQRQLHRLLTAPSVSIWEDRWRRVRLHSSIDDRSISTSYFAGQKTFISTDIIDGQLKIDFFGSSWRSRGFFWT